MRVRVMPGVLLFLAIVALAQAGGRRVQGAPSLDRILPELRRNMPGTLYDVQGPFPGRDGRARYRIKWMTHEGRIVWFEADARTGQVLGMVTGTMPSHRRDWDDEYYGPPERPYPRDGDDWGGEDRNWHQRQDDGDRDARERGPDDRGPGDRGSRERGPDDRGPGDRGSRKRGPNDRGHGDRGSKGDRGSRDRRGD